MMMIKVMIMMMMMMMMAVIVRWCPPLSVDPCIGRHTHYKTLAQNDDDEALSKKDASSKGILPNNLSTHPLSETDILWYTFLPRPGTSQKTIKTMTHSL